MNPVGFTLALSRELHRVKSREIHQHQLLIMTHITTLIRIQAFRREISLEIERILYLASLEVLPLSSVRTAYLDPQHSH